MLTALGGSVVRLPPEDFTSVQASSLIVKEKLLRAEWGNFDFRRVWAGVNGTALPPIRWAAWGRGSFLAVFAVKQVTNGLSAGCIQLACCSTVYGFGFCTRRRVFVLLQTAFRAAVGKARLVRFQFKLLRTDDTDLSRKRHFFFMIANRSALAAVL
jgi:hypothetical protein